MDELPEYEPTEEECYLYYMLDMLDTIIAQMMWLRELIEQEMDRIADEA